MASEQKTSAKHHRQTPSKELKKSMSSFLSILSFVTLGIFAGVLSGTFGIGGGLIIVPLLVLLFKMSQLDAQGTSLMVLLPPVGLLAAMYYYKSGHVKIAPALWIALGLFLGGLLGAKFANSIDPKLLKKLYGLFLILVGLSLSLR